MEVGLLTLILINLLTNPWMSLLEERQFGSEAEICLDASYRASLANGEMLLVGTEPWRTTVTWSEASAWSELTTVDMFTFMHRPSGLGVEGGELVYLFSYFQRWWRVLGGGSGSAWKRGKDAESRHEGKWDAHRWMLAVSSLKSMQFSWGLF